VNNGVRILSVVLALSSFLVSAGVADAESAGVADAEALLESKAAQHRRCLVITSSTPDTTRGGLHALLACYACRMS
jgi:hypothetical protein